MYNKIVSDVNFLERNVGQEYSLKMRSEDTGIRFSYHDGEFESSDSDSQEVV